MGVRKSLHPLFVALLTVALLPLTAAAQPAPQGTPESVEMAGAPAPAGPPLPQFLLWDNGPLVTHPGGGYNGHDASAVQTALGMNQTGFLNDYAWGERLADDFVIAGPRSWQIDSITFFAFQRATYPYPPPSTLTGVYYQIWDGPPNDPGSSVVFGDLVTNRLINTYWSGIYRVLDTDLLNAEQPVMAGAAGAGVVLPPGTYWLDWSTDAAGEAWVLVPPVTILGQLVTGNAMQFIYDTWFPALDPLSGAPQGLPFLLEGSVLVGDDPAILVTPDALSAQLAPDRSTSRTLSVCNVGGADLTWSLFEAPPPDVPWLSEDPTGGTLPPEECVDVTVTFDSAGLGSGDYDATLVIDSNDPLVPQVIVPAHLAVKAGAWRLTGSLNGPHHTSSATLLLDGRVLVVGGNNLGHSEVYDPVTQLWTKTQSIWWSNWGHTATLLPDGRVLVTGGHRYWSPAHGSYSTIVALWNPATGQWTYPTSLLAERAYHTATLLPDGRVLIAGGKGPGSGCPVAELLDPATGARAWTGRLHDPRAEHTATLLPDGRVLVAGGYNGKGSLSSAELYDPATGLWTRTGSLLTARRGHTATLLPDGRVLVAGGRILRSGGHLNSAELYDALTGQWSATGLMGQARSRHTATLLPNGRVLLAGGLGGPATSAEWYDPTTGQWSAVADMNVGHWAHMAALLPNGKVLVVGGMDAGRAAELFDPLGLEAGP